MAKTVASLTMAAQMIKESISAMNVGEAMGLEIRHGRCRCPVHGGNDYNCVLYKGNRGYYCHVCHAGGDVIGFVQDSMFGGKQKGAFRAAVKWIIDEFGLDIDIDSKPDEESVRKANAEQRTRRLVRELESITEQMKFELYLDCGKTLRMLEDLRDQNVPSGPDEVWNSKFRFAVENIPLVRNDLMMAELMIRGD